MCICAFIGCSNEPKTQDLTSILNDELLISYQDIDNVLLTKRSTLLFSEGQEVDDCAAYNSLSSQYKIEESVYNQQVKSEYLICDALNILSRSPLSPSKKFKSFPLGEKILTKLDLRTFPSSLNRLASESSNTLKSLYSNQVSFNDNTVELQTEDWSFSLQVVAIARLNDNLNPDWIIWVADESKSGNYRGYSTIIIYDPGEQLTYKATKYP